MAIDPRRSSTLRLRLRTLPGALRSKSNSGKEAVKK